ncbi:hypothetical protein [Haloimpatiens lingqiaonensis]|uniref:hypothetical protein n=1 Tax=Haloimpatiens lingqiaonensis TaxID=1380675 RepID=UPI0010FD2697|nr:hypothetical protein [Haloimpatiens lingqiaonensis]
MDFNKVFEQMFSGSGDNKGFNPMNYADLLGGLGSGGGNSRWLLILLLLLLCCCGNSGFGNLGGYGQCNNRCFDLCCRRKKHCRKKYKKYECYLDPCSCSYGSYGSYGCGYSWICVIIFIVIICCLGGRTGKGNRSCANNVINVDTAE